MIKRVLLLITCSLFLVLFGCAPQDQSVNQLDYDQTKKMVVDILKTDDGKKAIQDVLAEDGSKQKLVMDQAIVSKTIESTLTSDKGTEYWKKTFADPKFASAFAKSMQKEHETLMKRLMKDPEYQGMLVELMKDPELEKQVVTILKSREYRSHLQKVVSDTFESPIFQTKIQKILIKAAEEMQGGKKSSSGDGGDQGQKQEES